MREMLFSNSVPASNRVHRSQPLTLTKQKGTHALRPHVVLCVVSAFLIHL